MAKVFDVSEIKQHWAESDDAAYFSALEESEALVKHGLVEVGHICAECECAEEERSGCSFCEGTGFVRRDGEVKEEDGFTLPFVISTGAIDRDNDTINPLGWDLKDFRKNPVVLWSHDPRQPPVARAPETFVDREAKVLRSVSQFPSAELFPFGNMVGRMFKQKFLNAASVGFKPTKMSRNDERDGFAPTDFIKQKLLEWSAVPIPSNPEALVQARGAGIDTAPMLQWAEKCLDGEGGLYVPRAHLEELWSKSGDGVSVQVAKDGERFRLEVKEPEPIAESAEPEAVEQVDTTQPELDKDHKGCSGISRAEAREVTRETVKEALAQLKDAVRSTRRAKQ